MSNKTESLFADPYGEDEQPGKARLTTWIPEEDRMFLLGVRPMRGTVQTTINMLLKGLIDECKRRGVDDYHDAAKFEQIVVDRSSVGGPLNPQRVETTEPNDGGRTANVHQPHSTGEGQPANVQRGGRRRKAPVVSGTQDGPGEGGNVGPV